MASAEQNTNPNMHTSYFHRKNKQTNEQKQKRRLRTLDKIDAQSREETAALVLQI